MPRALSHELFNVLKRPNPRVFNYVEFAQEDAGNVIRGAQGAWLSDPPLLSQTPAAGLASDIYGGLSIVASNAAIANFTNVSNVSHIQGDQVTPTGVSALVWTIDPALDHVVLKSIRAKIKRFLYPAAFAPVPVQLQLYRVESVPGMIRRSNGSFFGMTELTFTPLLSPAPVINSNDPGLTWSSDIADFTYDLSPYRVVIDGAFGTPLQTGVAGDLPQILIVISIPGWPASGDACQWVSDTVSNKTVAGVGTFEFQGWTRQNANSNWVVSNPTGHTMNCTVNVETYAPPLGATHCQGIYAIDCGKTPDAGATGRIVFEAATPTGTSVLCELSTAGSGGPWTAVKNGDLVTTRQEDYWLRLTLTPSASNHATPTITAAGVEWRFPLDASFESVINFPDKQLDLPFLAASIGEGTIEVLKTGSKDFNDFATQLMTKQAPTSLEADIYVASSHPTVTRDKWLHVERLQVTNHVPTETSEKLTLLTYNQQLKRKIPRTIETISTNNTIVRTGTTQNKLIINPATPLIGTPYNGLGYYIRVQSAVDGTIPVGYTQLIDGSTSTNELDFVTALPGSLTDGDIVEVHSGVFAVQSIVWDNMDPADVWLDILTTYLQIPSERIGFSGLGSSNKAGLPPSVSDRAPGDPTTQAKLKVTMLVSEATDADQLLDQLSFIMGGATIEEAGQIVFVPIYPTTNPVGQVVVALPPPVMTFAPQDYVGLQIDPGLEKRAVVVNCMYGVDKTSADPSATAAQQTSYVDVDALNYLTQQDLDQFGTTNISDDINRWCFNTADHGLYLAGLLCRQVVLACSNGMITATWSTVDRYPDLRIGDVVSISTDQFAVFDPGTQNTLTGWLNITCVLTSVKGGGVAFVGYVQGLKSVAGNVKGGGAGTISGGPSSPPSSVPTITATVVTENTSLFPLPYGSVTFTPPTADPNFSRLDLLIHSNATGSTDSVITGNATGSISLGSLHWSTVYTITPVYVSTAAVRTNGTPVTLTTPNSNSISRTFPFSDGGFSAISTTNDGKTLHSGVKDNGGRALNLFVAKPLASSPDTIDSVADGTSFQRTTPSQVTGAGRAFTAIDSGGILIPASIDLARAYTNKTIDNIADGTSFQRTTPSQVTGAGRAFTAIDSGGIMIPASIDLSRAYTNKQLDNIPDGTSFKRIATAYVTSNKPSKVWSTTYGQDVSPNDIQKNLGTNQSSNLVINGGGQDGTIGVQATGWTLNIGNGLLIANDQVYQGTQSLKIINATAAKSSSFQHVNVVDQGVYVLSGFIRTSATSGSDPLGAGLHVSIVSGVTSFTLLETSYGVPGTTAPDVGLAPNAGTVGFTYVQSIFQVNGTGVINVMCAVGIASTITGTAWFDNVQLIPLSPSITSGGFFAGLSFDGPNQLSSATTQTDGVAQRVIAKGHISGLAANTATITYTTAFQNVPLTILSGGISYEPRAKWNASGDGTGSTAVNASLPQYDDLTPLNATASGFTMRARLRQKGTPTSRTNNYPVGNLTSVGSTSTVTLANAPAANDQYTSNFSITVTVSGFGSVSNVVVVAMDTNDGSGWVERATNTYSAAGTNTDSETYSSQTLLVAVSGLTATAQARLRIKSMSLTGSGVHGTVNLTPTSVTYITSGSDQYASKTPDAGDTISWDSIATS